MVEKIKKYSKEINQSLNDINKLIEVPSLIQKMTLNSLQGFDVSQFKNTEKTKFGNLIQSIKNINDESIKEAFKIIYNQACVLAVSALSATLEKYFINFVVAHWNKINFSKEEVKLSLAEISKYNFIIKPFLGEILLEKVNSINFQDLQATKRSFNKYCKKAVIVDDETEKFIIFYQQCRHVLVHKNGHVDKEFLKKVENNNIKNYRIGEKIELNKVDWENIKINFSKLVNLVTTHKSEYDLVTSNRDDD